MIEENIMNVLCYCPSLLFAKSMMSRGLDNYLIGSINDFSSRIYDASVKMIVVSTDDVELTEEITFLTKHLLVSTAK